MFKTVVQNPQLILANNNRFKILHQEIDWLILLSCRKKN